MQLQGNSLSAAMPDIKQPSIQWLPWMPRVLCTNIFMQTACQISAICHYSSTGLKLSTNGNRLNILCNDLIGRKYPTWCLGTGLSNPQCYQCHYAEYYIGTEENLETPQLCDINKIWEYIQLWKLQKDFYTVILPLTYNLHSPQTHRAHPLRKLDWHLRNSTEVYTHACTFSADSVIKCKHLQDNRNYIKLSIYIII